MEKQDGERIRMTDGPPCNSMIRRGSTVFKAKCNRGHEITYVEIDLEEYDRRVQELADLIAGMPGVDLKAILKDALYDLQLDHLKAVEAKVKAEVQKPAPAIKTQVATSYRGTCVNLNVAGRNVCELRH